MSINFDKWRPGLTEVARKLIREIPADKLSYAKPAWIYETLQSMGFARNATMRTTVCKLLMKAKNSNSYIPDVVGCSTRSHIFLAQKKIAEAFKLLNYDAQMLLAETSQVVSIASVIKEKQVLNEQEVVIEPQESKEKVEEKVTYRDLIRQFINKMTLEQLSSTTPKLICYELGLEDNQDAYQYTTKFIYKKRKKIKLLDRTTK